MEEEFKLVYDSLNKYYHYLILHVDGLYDDLIKKNFNFLQDNFIDKNNKNLTLICIKDGKNIFYNSYTEEDRKVLDDYITFNDDFIIIKNPSYVYECFNINSEISNILRPFNKSVDIIGYVDTLKHGTKNLFRIFAGKTHYLDVNNHQETFDVNFDGDYIIIKTGFTSKIKKENLEAYLERYKYLPNFLFLKDGETIIKNKDVFTADSPRKIEEVEVDELMKSLENFTKADINDGFIVFASDYKFKSLVNLLYMLKEFKYCNFQGLIDISRIVKFDFGDYKRALYLRLDCEEI